MAIDPGEKVGWATADVDGSKITGLKHGITDLKSFALRLVDVYGKYDVIIMESFRLSAAKSKHLVGSTLPTVQFIGMLRLLAWQNPKTRLIEQAPSVKATAFKTMETSKPAWHRIVSQPGSHDTTHDYDAIAHLWYWVWRTYV